MPDQTPNLSLPFILPAQAQKHVTHNEAIELLDMIVQLTLESTTAITPPATANEGQAWVLGTGATGDWTGQDNNIATWRGGGWLFVTPRDGWQAWVNDVAAIQVLTSGSWVTQGELPPLENLPGLGVNAVSDPTNRLSVSSDATLLNNDGAGHQLKINKASVGDTASLLYQSAFVGRAEMGLAGEHDFSIKVSADGSAWTTALSITAGSGRAQFAEVLALTPGSEPASAVAGDVYFDSSSAKLRCYNGAIWNDLF
jgi:hypothetical protein